MSGPKVDVVELRRQKKNVLHRQDVGGWILQIRCIRRPTRRCFGRQGPMEKMPENRQARARRSGKRKTERAKNDENRRIGEPIAAKRIVECSCGA